MEMRALGSFNPKPVPPKPSAWDFRYRLVIHLVMVFCQQVFSWELVNIRKHQETLENIRKHSENLGNIRKH